MRVSTIALANLKRRKGKAVFLVVGMAIGIGTVVALVSLSGSIKEEIGVQLDRFGANIVVVPRSNTLSLDYGGITVSGVSFDVHQLTDEDANNVRDIPFRDRISLVAPKILGAVDVEGNDILMAGVDFDSELKLKRWWRLVGAVPAQQEEIIVGYGVAEALGLIETPHQDGHVEPSADNNLHAAGDSSSQIKVVRHELKIGGREHNLVGVLAPTGGREDGMIFGLLPHVQTLLGKPGQLSLIEVSALCKDCPVEDIVAQIGARLPHAKPSAIQQSARARTETVDRLTRFSGVVSAVVLIIGALMIFTTVMGSVIERTKEIGVMRAIGFRKSHIIKGLMIETVVISVVGGLLGWAVGVGASWAALPYFSQTGIKLEVEPVLAAAAIGAALITGIVSSLYPAMRASRLDPCESIRAI